MQKSTGKSKKCWNRCTNS